MLNKLKEIFFRRKKIILTLFFIFLVFGIIFLGTDCYFLNKEVKTLEKNLGFNKKDTETVEFLNLFIEKVLQTSEDISLEDRLELENSVRNLEDGEILSIWKSFTEATNADDVQAYCKNLLEALARKLL